MKQEFLTVRKTFNGRKLLPTEIRESIIFHTKFLNYDAPITTRVSYLFEGVTQQLACNTCQAPLTITTPLQSAAKYCSWKCSAQNPQTKALREKTSILKYGASNPAKTEKIKQRIQSTSLERYGVSNPAKAEKIRKQISEAVRESLPQRTVAYKKTMIARYGVEHPSQLESVKLKKQSTSRARYGVDYYWQTDEFKAITAKRLSTLGVTNYSQLPEIKQKIANTKLARYGNAAYNNGQKTKQTMQQAYGCHHKHSHWNNSTRTIMEDPQLLADFIKNKTINTVADELSIAPTTVRNRLIELNITDFAARKNQYESLVKDHLTQLGIKFTRNNRSVLNGQELDFYLPEQNLAIECNGIFWHSELMGKSKIYHLEKTRKAAAAGVKLVHFWDYQFDRSPELVLSMISHIVGKTAKTVGARQCKCVEISANDYRTFLKQNHLQSSVNSSIKLGLVHDTTLIAVLGLGRSRFTNNEVELHRFAVKTGYHIPGGASKLFHKFLEIAPECMQVVSYADRDFSIGNLYNALGFHCLGETAPSYLYFKGRTVYNRIAYQKHKLSRLLDQYDPSLTEWQNMQLNGYNRFWNTGTLKYEYTRPGFL